MIGPFRPVVLRHHARILPPAAGQVLVTASIGPDQELVAVWAPPAGRDEPRGPGPVPVLVTVQQPDRPDVAELRARVPGLAVARFRVQPLPGGCTLFAGVRCRLLPGGPEQNAVIVDASGEVVRTGVLGDGIDDLLTTRDGDIWVSYLDEGVLGNHGWGEPRAAPPIGQPGLVRFDADIQVAWRFPFERLGPMSIMSCNGINVGDDEVWATYIVHAVNEWHVARVGAGGEVSTWAGDVPGARAVLAGPDRIALIGGYAPPEPIAATAPRPAGEVVREATRTLVMPGEPGFSLTGRVSAPQATPVGRGPHLHVLTGTDWYRLDLDDLA